MKTYENYYCCIKDNVFDVRTIAENKKYSKELLAKQFVKKPTWLKLKKQGYQYVLVDININPKK